MLIFFRYIKAHLNGGDRILNVKDILKSKGPEVVMTGNEKSIYEAIGILVGHSMSALPVLNETGKIVGIISERDIIRENHKNYGSDVIVKDVMAENIIIGDPDLIKLKGEKVHMLMSNLIFNRRQNDRFRSILILLLSVVLISGCNSKNKKSALELNINSGMVEVPYQITLWQGGGFTGITTGFTLSSAGEVTHWQRFPGQSDSVLWIMKGYSSEIQKLRSQLEESGALEMKYAETGNMTAVINYEIKDEKYTWTWNQTGAVKDIPESLRSWYQNAMNFCQSLQQKK